MLRNASRTLVVSRYFLGGAQTSKRRISRTLVTSSVQDGEDENRSSSGSPWSLQQLWNPTPEHSFLRESLRTFVEREVEGQAEEFNKKEVFNVDLFRKLGTNSDDGLGLLGLTIDEKYGGTNMDASAVALVHEELSYSDPAFCLSYLAHSILLGHNLYMNGSDQQKELYLPQICSGTYIGGMGMSEPNAGTDVLGMQTRAVESTDATGLKKGWILNGTKMWITNGTLDGTSTGDLFLVYARTGPGKFDITQFLVTKGMPGFSLGQKIQDKLGMRASMTAELVFDNVFVPHENVVGQVDQATICMMRNLEIERISLAAMGLGIARRCLDEMIAYSGSRSAFGARTLFDFGQIQRLIAESYAEYMAGRSYVYATANALQLHSTGNTLDADGTKLFCAAMSKNVADRAIQVLGGNGYIGAYKVERFWRDAKLLEIGGGTNESHHKNMVRDLRKLSRRLD
jgi:isovaleryl-CoA dehydrogenase